MTAFSFKTAATPIVIGSFALTAVTGVLMFFHLDSGLNKVAHEWLSWAFLAGALWHISINWKSFCRYWQQPPALIIIALFAVVLAASFVPIKGKADGKPQFMAPIHAMARAPLPTLAPVLGMDMPTLRAHLHSQGIEVQSDTQSLEALVGSDARRQVDVLAKLTRAPARP
ncbi:MAG: DUF4405 domain-containing protein [Rhodoferax sp.]